jgi:hypothetical protein
MKTLIGQARRRQHRRRIALALVVVTLGAAGGIAYGLESGGSGSARTATGRSGFATIVRAGTKYVVVKPSTGQVIRLCLAPAPNAKFSPAPTSHSGWVADSSSAVREWIYTGAVTACKR